MLLVYITNPDFETAKKIAKHLLEGKLIACANIFPITSIFKWQNKTSEEGEYALVAKTTQENFQIIQKEVELIHPYQVPCILSINADANPGFLKWVEESVA